MLKKYGLTPTMYPPGPGGSIAEALNRNENHEKLEPLMHAAIDEAKANGVPNIITFSGNRKSTSDAEGADNCVAFLNKVKAHAEDKGINICMEYLNSKVNHKDYMFDHIAWGVDVMKRVNCEDSVRYLPRPDHGRRYRAQHPRPHTVDRALPHRRQSGPEGNRRDAGIELPLHRAGHSGPEFHRLHRARIFAESAGQRRGQPQAGDRHLHGLNRQNLASQVSRRRNRLRHQVVPFACIGGACFSLPGERISPKIR
jgi:hypothetical protein